MLEIYTIYCRYLFCLTYLSSLVHTYIQYISNSHNPRGLCLRVCQSNDLNKIIIWFLEQHFANKLISEAQRLCSLSPLRWVSSWHLMMTESCQYPVASSGTCVERKFLPMLMGHSRQLPRRDFSCKGVRRRVSRGRQGCTASLMLMLAIFVDSVGH